MSISRSVISSLISALMTLVLTVSLVAAHAGEEHGEPAPTGFQFTGELIAVASIAALASLGVLIYQRRGKDE